MRREFVHRGSHVFDSLSFGEIVFEILGRVGDLVGHLDAAAFFLGPAAVIENVVGCEAVEPRRERVFRPVAAQVGVRLDKHFAHQIIDLVGGGPVAPRHAGHHPLIPSDQLPEGLLVAVEDRPD